MYNLSQLFISISISFFYFVFYLDFYLVFYLDFYQRIVYVTPAMGNEI